MAFLYIAEFTDISQVPSGRIQVVRAAPIVEQRIAIGGGSAQSATFDPRTRVVRLHPDAICSIAFGTNPTAAVTNARMSAGQTEYFAVNPADGLKVATITNT